MSNKSSNQLFVRIVTADYYLTSPNSELNDPCYSDFRSNVVSQVPIIRIFGPSITGVKTCIHVHGVFPYIFIPNADGGLLKQDLYQLATSLDKAINVSYGNSSSNSQHVYNIIQVFGRPFYGYHLKEEMFLKISFYNPVIAKRAADLLQNGVIFNRVFQPHEAHIPFVLQFFIDYNLYGMSLIKLSTFKERRDKQLTDYAHSSTNVCDFENVSFVTKQSFSSLEIDVTVSDIMNANENSGRVSNNPGLAFIFEEERRRNLEQKSNESADTSRLTAELKSTSSELYFRDKLNEKLNRVLKELEEKGEIECTKQDNSYCNSSILDEEKILRSTQNSSYSEFNSQGRDIFNLLQNLMETSELDNASSPDDLVQASQEYQYEIECSQPVFKQHVENDSILGGCTVSDDEGGSDEDLTKDELPINTTTVVSSSIDNNESAIEKSGSNFKLAQCDWKMTQLDGVNGSSSDSSENAGPINENLKLRSKKSSSSSYNLRNKNFNQLDPIKCNSLNKNVQNKDIDDIRRSANSEKIRPKMGSKKMSGPTKLLYPKLPIRKQKYSRSSVSSDTQNVASSSELACNHTAESVCLTSNTVAESCVTNSDSISDEQFGKHSIELEKKNEFIEKSAQHHEISTKDNNSDVRNYTNERKMIGVAAAPSSLSDAGTTGISEQKKERPNIILTPKQKPPTTAEVLSYLTDNCLPRIKNKLPYYDNVADVTVGKNICGKLVKVENKFVSELDEFKGFVEVGGLESIRYSVLRHNCNLSQAIGHELFNSTWYTSERLVLIGPLKSPPSYKDSLIWLKTNTSSKKEKTEDRQGSAKKEQVLFVPSDMYGVSDEEQDDKQSQSQSQSRSFGSTIIPDNDEQQIDKTNNTTSDNEKSVQKSAEENSSPGQHRHNVTCNSSERTVSPSFQIDCVTPENTYDFLLASQNLQNIKDDVHYQYITSMSLEVFVKTRSTLNPDPEYDVVNALFYSIINDIPGNCDVNSGVILIGNQAETINNNLTSFRAKFLYVDNEEQLFDQLINTVRCYDPDILIGYEVEMLSWGYLIHRGKYLGKHLDVELSRIKRNPNSQRKLPSVHEFKFEGTDLVGRIILNVWRLLRHEVTLQSYTFENILNHILHQRAQRHSFETLTMWWFHPLRRWTVVDYYLLRAESVIQVLQHLDFIGRTSELARLFGIQFYEVLSRGSQYRVESMMLRMAKQNNYVAASPSIQQRSKMKAPETVPLIMEPESRYYDDPVIVLDFQSLYPSIIIAYNYCFSTCLGRVQYLGQLEPYEFGCLKHFISPVILKQIQNNINISPCGVAFVDKSVQRGTLPTMLEEILEARLLVKKSMKQNKGDPILQRVLHARQLGLKLIANVTYGYTAANFSGRMPCIEVGDSVVSKGRETLERAIELILKNNKWKARVVYGDTDSIFVTVPGRSKDEAFQIGNEIANAVTLDNPKPVKLKFEKVFYPCILQTKKRYVGYMYETPEQTAPAYDAKGIETVRRDGCPAVAKILKKTLKLLFDTCNISLVKRYVQRQFEKLISGRISIQELTFAREYRGLAGYKPTACVPALKIAKEALMHDRRSEPRIKERVRYVIAAGHSSVPLIQLVHTPEQFLRSKNLRINDEYYITRVIIPPLDRCFSLLAVNVLSWYTELPKKRLIYLPNVKDGNQDYNKAGTISQYFSTVNCVVCHKMTNFGLCEECVNKRPQITSVTLANKINNWQRKYNYMKKICQSCCGNICQSDCCLNLDCPILYRKIQSERDAEQVTYLEELRDKYL